MDAVKALIIKAQQGDRSARAQLVAENTGLVWCVVKRFLGRGVESEDLFQIGTIGLLKAIDKFNLEYDVKFSTYAVPLITGEIKRFLRDDGMIKVSRSLKELSFHAVNAKEKLTEQMKREPTIPEIARYLEVDPEELTLALESGYEVESLHQPAFQGEGQEVSLMDKLKEENESEEMVLNKILIGQLLGILDKDERKLIYLRYFGDRTQSEVGKILGTSQVQVSRTEKKILKKLREQIRE